MSAEPESHLFIVQHKSTNKIAQFMRINDKSWRVYIQDQRRHVQLFTNWDITTGYTFPTMDDAIAWVENKGWKVLK